LSRFHNFGNKKDTLHKNLHFQYIHTYAYENIISKFALLCTKIVLSENCFSLIILIQESGYVAMCDLVNRKLRHHRSYHGKISGAETNALLFLAPEKGYITRYSEKKRRYVLSVCSPSLEVIQHHLLAVDEEALSYVVMGSGISFKSIDELLDHYENNPINSSIGEIGVSYSRINTWEFKRKHEEMKKEEAQQDLVKAEEQFEKAQQELERAKKNLNESTKKEDAQIPKSKSTDDVELCQATEESKVTSDEDNSNPERTKHLEELEELRRANADLHQKLEKRKSKHHGKCPVQ